MRSFDYTYLADRTWDNEILSYISKIHEYKGKQDLFLRQKPVELNRLTEIAKIPYLSSFLLYTGLTACTHTARNYNYQQPVEAAFY